VKSAVEYRTPGGFGGQFGKTLGNVGTYLRHYDQTVEGYRENSDNYSNSTYFSLLTNRERGNLRIVAFRGRSDNQMAYLASPLSEIEKNPRHNYLGSDEKDHFNQQFGSLEYVRAEGNFTGTVTGFINTLQGDYTVRLSQEDLWDFNLDGNWKGINSTFKYSVEGASLIVGFGGSTYYRTHFVLVDDNELYRNRGNKDEGSGFLKVEYGTGKTTVTADVQVRGTRFEYEPDRNSGKGWLFINPKIGLNYDFDKFSKFYLTFGEASREPSRNDMFAGFDNVDTTNIDFIGSLDRVKPETVRDVEIGYNFEGRRFFFKTTRAWL
jgi:iron complex outermembrane receptor protein